ncbi:MAG: zinc-finger domain-containing protein [Alphaproteobacteria bacterium]|nr:zinc-finger domain-containing protein [Alphaproteobacteria bacterium]OJV47102.1 MAG: hypothetical protein BGO28_01490 [Alphaproteobacteria bacterium 43-37]
MSVSTVQHPFEEIQVLDKTVRCNGGGGALGHPAVYLTLEKSGEVVCPYCSRKYVLVTKDLSEQSS